MTEAELHHVTWMECVFWQSSYRMSWSEISRTSLVF
jgi:hypothetical protein